MDEKKIHILLTPIMTKEKYATESGQTDSEVRGQMARKKLPTINSGHRKVINIVALFGADYCLVVPYMTPERLSDVSGLESGCIRSQIDEDNLKSTKFGRRHMVDLISLAWRCEQQALQSGVCYG